MRRRVRADIRVTFIGWTVADAFVSEYTPHTLWRKVLIREALSEYFKASDINIRTLELSGRPS